MNPAQWIEWLDNQPSDPFLRPHSLTPADMQAFKQSPPIPPDPPEVLYIFSGKRIFFLPVWLRKESGKIFFFYGKVYELSGGSGGFHIIAGGVDLPEPHWLGLN